MHAKFALYFIYKKVVYNVILDCLYTHLLTFKISDSTEGSNSGPVDP